MSDILPYFCVAESKILDAGGKVPISHSQATHKPVTTTHVPLAATQTWDLQRPRREKVSRWTRSDSRSIISSYAHLSWNSLSL